MTPFSADVAVVGLGAMGSAAATHLARRGLSVVGFDRFTPPHDRGSSHGGSRIIRQAYFEGDDYVPLVQRAWEQWERLEQYAGEPLLVPTGGLMLGPAGCDLVEGSRRSAVRFDLPHEMLDAAEVHRRWPALEPPAGTAAFFEERAGFVHPEAGVAAQLRAAVALGAALVPDTPVLRWEVTGDGVRVETPNGPVDAGRLVITAGPWAPELLAALGLPLQAARQVQFYFDAAGAAGDGHPVFVCEDDDATIFYGVPAHDGQGTKVGLHDEGGACTADDVDRAIHQAEIDGMRRRLERVAPSLAGGLLDARTCLYTNTPDGHFVIGLHPEHPQVAVAAGFSGHGFKFAPVVGEILADLATEGSTPLPIGLFSPGRFAAAG